MPGCLARPRSSESARATGELDPVGVTARGATPRSLRSGPAHCAAPEVPSRRGAPSWAARARWVARWLSDGAETATDCRIASAR
eukprot:scaffold92699_cov60-Phaeocystis_antarctica.AAC.3